MIRIKVSNGHRGWDTPARDAVVQLCREHNVVFLDRAGVLYGPFPGVNVLYAPDNDLGFENYVFFEHRNMEDLPFTMEVKI